MNGFDHERMEVYRLAMEFVALVNVMRSSFLSGRSGLADQLERAALSIPLNIAEGAGEFARREKARFYRMARRSATECAAILDVAGQLELVDPPRIVVGKELLHRIVGML